MYVTPEGAVFPQWMPPSEIYPRPPMEFNPVTHNKEPMGYVLIWVKRVGNEYLYTRPPAEILSLPNQKRLEVILDAISNGTAMIAWGNQLGLVLVKERRKWYVVNKYNVEATKEFLDDVLMLNPRLKEKVIRAKSNFLIRVFGGWKVLVRW